MKKIAFLITFFALFPLINAAAHGLVSTESAEVNGYIINLEYETLGDIKAEEVTTFNFEILNSQTEEEDFDRVFVRIIKQDGPIEFLANIYPLEVEGVTSARVRTVIPTAGPHDFQVIFYREGSEIAEHTFDINVSSLYNDDQAKDGEAGGARYLWVATLIIGVLAGGAIGKSKFI